MSDYNNEQLSALVDAESNDNPDLIDQLLHDKPLQATWSRYHLIGDCLRGHLSETISNEVATFVSRSLQAEPTILVPQKTKSINIKPIVGFAIAASVAIMVILGVQKGNEINTSESVPAVATNEMNATIPLPQSLYFQNIQASPATVNQSDISNIIINKRLNNYLMNHNEYRSNGSVNGILPYVRIVTMESQE